MEGREIELGRDDLGLAVGVNTVAEFLEAAARYPHSLVVLHGGAPVSASELRRYCAMLGGVMQFDQGSEVRTIKHDPSIPNSTAMSLNALAPHTDGTFVPRPPARFMLSFARSDDCGGGLSTFFPLSGILAAMPGWVVDALLKADCLFPRGYSDLSDAYAGPVLTFGGGALQIRWRSDDLWRPQVMDAHGTDAASAVDWLHEYLCSAEPYVFAAQVGDTLLVPNLLMLHGRTAMSAGSQREALRVWVAGREMGETI